MAARAAAHAYLDFGAWLRQDYLPAANPVDPVGRERYALAARYYTGSDLDLEDTYAFGWAELHRIEDQDGQRSATSSCPGSRGAR